MNLRPATPDDGPLLLAWRNDDATRWASVSRAPVTAEEHRVWLDTMLARPAHHRVWIAEEAGVPAGTLRFDLGTHMRMVMGRGETQFAALVNLTVAPERRGRGLGHQLLALADPEAQALGRTLLCATVRPDNSRSLVLFIKGGYQPTSLDAVGLVHLRKDLPAGQMEDHA